MASYPGQSEYEALLAAYQALTPFRVGHKGELAAARLLQRLLRRIRPGYQDTYTLVFGRGVYFPSEDFARRNPRVAARILAHEMVHLLDKEKLAFKPLFYLGYLFPQLLALGVLALPWLGGWSLLFLLALLPWPAPFRARIEWRAYAMDYLLAPEPLRAQTMAHIWAQFGGWAYYRMWPFRRGVERRVRAQAEALRSGRAGAAYQQAWQLHLRLMGPG
jgi:hypothetical protein